MRALSLAVVLAALLAPVAHAQGTFTLGAGKVVEGALEPGADVVFEMPLLVNQEGFLYAKVIPTPGNAVHDGTRANGSVAEGTGWRVTFALVRDGGERVELGTYADSRASPLVPVAAEERLTLVSTVHVPSDAALGGAEQTVYVAVAYRLEETAAASGSTSGASLDEARALTLRLSNARLPPVQAGPATPEPTPDEADAEPTTDPGPVQPISDAQPAPRVIVVEEGLPTWFLLGVLALLAGILAALVAIARTLMQLRRRLAPASSEPSDAVERTARAGPVAERLASAHQE